jgi:hypothetical protein
MFILYVAVKWITSGHFQRTPTGPDRASSWMLGAVHAFDILGPAVFVVVVHRFIVKPWRSGCRRLTTDGVLFLTWLAMFPMDNWLNYARFQFSYNASHWLQFGSDLGAVPGVAVAHAYRSAEPLLFTFPGYVWGMCLWGVLGSAVMKRAKRRWPHMKVATLFVLTWVFFVVLDLIAEPGILIPLGLESYHGVVGALAIFGGSRFQYPLYNAGLFALVWLAAAALRYFRDDLGYMIPERGINHVAVSDGMSNVLRVLAAIGFAAVIFPVAYSLPMNLISSFNDSTPSKVPSYFQQGICGPRTSFTCPNGGG